MEADEATQLGDDQGASLPPLRFERLEDAPPEYVNYFYVQNDNFAFHVLFGRILPPLIITDEDRRMLQAQGFKVEVVSRLILAPETLRQLVRVMQEQLDLFEAAHGPTSLQEPEGQSTEGSPDGD